MVEVFYVVGILEDVFQNVFFDYDIILVLIVEKFFGFVNFIGFVGGGKVMEKVVVGMFIGVGLEFGGKDLGYVMDDVDLDVVVDMLIDGVMFNVGQCCCGIECIYVVESFYDVFVEKVVKIVEGYKLGDLFDLEIILGLMVYVCFVVEVCVQM